MATITTATYTKLRDGSWGIRVPGTVAAGATVTVTKKSGESKTETVDRVLWTGNGVSLCNIAPHSHSAGSRHGHSGHSRRMGGGGRYECEECGDYVYPGSRCWETGMTH